MAHIVVIIGSIAALLAKGNVPSALWVATWGSMSSAAIGILCKVLPYDCIGNMTIMAPFTVGVLASLLPHLNELLDTPDLDSVLEDEDMFTLLWVIDPWILASQAITDHLGGYHTTRKGIAGVSNPGHESPDVTDAPPADPNAEFGDTPDGQSATTAAPGIEQFYSSADTGTTDTFYRSKFNNRS